MEDRKFEKAMGECVSTLFFTALTAKIILDSSMCLSKQVLLPTEGK